MPTDPTTSIEDVIRRAVSEPILFDSNQDRREASFKPRMDIKDTAREFVAYIDLPGIDEDELNFNWDKDVLTISGCRDFNHDSEDAEEFTQIQRIFGDFLCRIPLVDSADVSRATAKYKRGVLVIRIPKHRHSSR